MDEQLKKRLVGAAVLMSLTVIFLPMILVNDRGVLPVAVTTEIPPWPERSKSPGLLKDAIPAPEPFPEPVPEPVAESPGDQATKDTSGTRVTKKKVQQVEPRVGLSAWIIQVGSFSNRENANKLVKKLRAAGLDTMSPEQVEVRGNKIYRVQVGPEVDRDNAVKLLPKIKKVSGLDGQIKGHR